MFDDIVSFFFFFHIIDFLFKNPKYQSSVSVMATLYITSVLTHLLS